MEWEGEVDDDGKPCPCRINNGNHDNFITIGRDGKDWQPLNARTDIPYGTKITITLNEMLEFHDEPICTSTWYSLFLVLL